MKRRNWLDLSRKLVDRFDLTFTEDSIESALDSYADDYFGAGVAQTPAYPNGLLVTLSSGSLGGSVSAGVAFDPDGNRIPVLAPTAYVITTADLVNPRRDLLVLRYKKTGTNPIPKPSDPITTVFLNLVDDFDLVVIPGVAAPSPAYPTTLANDVILDGILIPAGALLGTSCTLDDSVRMYAVPPASRLLRRLSVVGAVDGANRTFIVTPTPSDPLSVIVSFDADDIDTGLFNLTGDVLVFDPSKIPAAGQEVIVYALIGQTGAMAQSANIPPGGRLQLVPIAVGDGATATFPLPVLPIDSRSVIAVVDGVLWLSTEYNPTLETLTFNPGKIPAAGQTIEALVLTGSTAIIGLTPSGGGGLPFILGTSGAGIVVDPAVGIVISPDPLNVKQIIFVKSMGGQQNVTADPQISNGTSIGQEVQLIGTDNVNYPTLIGADGAVIRGVSQNGDSNFKQDSTTTYTWIGARWLEKGRQ